MKVLVVRRTGSPTEMILGRDVWWHEAMESADSLCEPEIMDAEDPLFILYTSGSTGKPKGVMHTTGGYMVYTSTTHHYIFDYKPEKFIGVLLILDGLQAIHILCMDLWQIAL